MAARPRVPLGDAEVLAFRLMEIFGPVCERIQVAGSIRRRKGDVGDIELVMIPRHESVPDPASLFGDQTVPVNRQYELACRLRGAELLDRVDVNGRPCFGEAYQRVVFEGVAVDLFCTNAEEWGITLAVRTGSADFARKLMTPKVNGGFLQMGQRVQGWRLIDRGVTVPTPEEEAFFEAIELPWISPEVRR
jgi:DNA polymerase/3'-5' exonuclease PolX